MVTSLAPGSRRDPSQGNKGRDTLHVLPPNSIYEHIHAYITNRYLTHTHNLGRKGVSQRSFYNQELEELIL